MSSFNIFKRFLCILCILVLCSCGKNSSIDIKYADNALDINVDNCLVGSRGSGQITINEDEAIYIDHDLPENGFVEVLIIDQKQDRPVINKVFDSHGEYMHKLNEGEYELYFRVIENSKGTINVYTQKNK